MPCEHYKDALIEAAATGLDPANALASNARMAALRAHFESCASCRAAFAEEQALFISIDAGLNATANAEVPASLLPRVRARLDEAANLNRIWTANWFALASAALVVVVFFAARAVWHPNVEQNPAPTSVRTNSPGSIIQPSQSSASSSVPLPKNESASSSRGATAAIPSLPERPAVRNAMPEVLVPRDQEDLLVSYAQQWNLRKRAPLVAANSDATNMSPLQIAPIQIAQLDVKLMTEEQAQ
jgi:hypothetical protein